MPEGYCQKCKGAEITTPNGYVCEDCGNTRLIKGK